MESRIGRGGRVEYEKEEEKNRRRKESRIVEGSRVK